MTTILASPPPSLHPSPFARTPASLLLILSTASLAFLAAWIYIFRYTGDGDAVLHDLNARETADRIIDGLGAWARPAFKLPLALVAVHGLFPARIFCALITLACMWQTIRLAEDLRLPNALAAAPMLLFQASVFPLAADTMTELPMALGLVVATRLWLHRRCELSGLVIGFLPLARPEGFFLGVLWGIMVVLTPKISFPRRLRVLALMTVGLLTWSVLCRIFANDWLLVVHSWSWPAQSYDSYGRGPLWYFLARWPEYCGLPLFVLFTVGAWNLAGNKLRPMPLVAVLWLLIFSLHTLLFWRGLFASCGLIRVLASAAPMTALICLHGWNILAPRLPRRALIPFLALTALWAVAQYFLWAERLYTFPLTRCADFIRANHLLGPDTPFLAGNKIITAELDLPAHSPHILELTFNAEKDWRNLTTLPPGTLVVWDNRQSTRWYSITLEQIEHAGFVPLHEETLDWPVPELLNGGHMRFVVFRKPAPQTAASHPALPG